MIYEGTITYVTVNEKGNDQNVKEQLILENAESFTDAEEQLYDYGSGCTALDVTNIKRSKLKEIANERADNDEKIFVATLLDVFLAEDGSEKELKYDIAFFSKSMDAAHAYIREYASQGYNMSIKGIKETKFVDILR